MSKEKKEPRTAAEIVEEITRLGLRLQDLCVEGRDSSRPENQAWRSLFESLRCEAEGFYGKASTLETEIESSERIDAGQGQAVIMGDTLANGAIVLQTSSYDGSDHPLFVLAMLQTKRAGWLIALYWATPQGSILEEIGTYCDLDTATAEFEIKIELLERDKAAA